MGRVFIEKYEDDRAVFCCKNCNTGLFKIENVMLENVETVSGLCMGVVNVMNVLEYETNGYSNMYINNMINTYDCDAPFNTQGVSAKCVMCKYCLMFIGWLHEYEVNMYMIKKLNIELVIS